METIEIENAVGRKRTNKSQEKESSHKSIWKVLAQVSLHRMVDWGIELKFAKVTRETKKNCFAVSGAFACTFSDEHHLQQS